MPQLNATWYQAARMRLAHSLQALQQPWFAYLTLLCLQLKVIWQIWKYRDLTSGDTASYFTKAYLWFQDLSTDIIWSPLYTVFYGSLLHLSEDAYTVTIMHRVIIVLVLSMMVLALMRRLLPAGIAWLVAAWWVILPVNFNALYEVHLFAVIPVLAAWLLALARPSPWARGGALAILFASMVLVRNELIVAVGIFSVLLLWWEIRERRRATALGRPNPPLRRLAASYGLPLIAAALVILFFYTRSMFQFPELLEASAPKHTKNMCQVYAYGYQQRHPEWKNNPWTECSGLMLAEFGKTFPSLGEMIRSNSRAVLTHFLWNFRLTPNGIQLLLFNAASGSVSPDYIPVQLHSQTALLLSIVLGGILLAGLVMLYRERQYWWKFWLRDRMPGWLAMSTAVAVALVVIPTQRPRPSYLFTLGLFLMALTGMCLFVIGHRWKKPAWTAYWLPLVMVATLVIVPSYYSKPEHRQPPKLLTLYRRLAPFAPVLTRPDTILLVNNRPLVIYRYVTHTAQKDLVQLVDYRVLHESPAAMPLETILDSHGINLFYVNEQLWSSARGNPLYQQFLDAPGARGWKILAVQEQAEARWMLLQKQPAGAGY